MKALSISEKNHWERLMTLEAKYSLAARWLEYELVPLCLDQGVAILAWSPLHGGYLTGKYRRDQPLPEISRFRNLTDKSWKVDQPKLFDIIDELDKIAHRCNADFATNSFKLSPAKTGKLVNFRREDRSTAGGKYQSHRLGNGTGGCVPSGCRQ